MSYGDARLDLTHVSVACLNGLNGSGKSALLDAITWALWESARAGSEELVRLGQNEMWVDLCFSLEGQIYRVRRSRRKSYTRKGDLASSKGTLDFQIWQVGVSGWLSLNASSMRETQKRLRELLRMDYETFISSVYLRQGRADEFTLRSAAERKQVIADILGLDSLDRLQALCRQEARQCKGRIQVLEAGMDRQPDLEKGFSACQEEMESLGLELAGLDAELERSGFELLQLQEQIGRLHHLKIKFEHGEIRLAELKALLENLRQRRQELLLQKQKLEALLALENDVSARLQDFEKLKAESELLDHKSAEYDAVSSRRMELRSAIAMWQGRLEVELEHLQALLQAKEERCKQLKKSSSGDQKLSQAYGEYARLLEAELEMSRKRETFVSLSQRLEDLQALINEARVRIEVQIQQQEKLLSELDELLANREALRREQDLLASEILEMEKTEAEFELVEEKGMKIKGEIDLKNQFISQLKKSAKNNEANMKELVKAPNLSTCPLCRSAIVDAKAVLDKYARDNELILAELGELQMQESELECQRDSLRKQYLDLRKRLALRKDIDRRIGEFNERKAALERAEAGKDELARQIAASKCALEENSFATLEKESLIAIRAELLKLDFDPVIFANFQAQMRAQRSIEIKYQQRQRELRELAELEAEIPLLAAKASAIDLQLANRTFAPEESLELKNLEDALLHLAYDKDRHKLVKQELSELFPYLEKARAVANARAELPAVLEQLELDETMLAAKEKEISELEFKLSDWSLGLEKLPLLEDDFESLKSEKEKKESCRSELARELHVLEARIEQLKENKSEFDSKQKQLAESIESMSQYNILAEAFGKKGIQAIIIENAIPEIEVEANKILSRLSENRMHLALITQQRTKQGHAVETLEIMIADEVGSRSYELYSGGEAFKVNFALRLAISRLLARRSGARLETLIIDEGFGSQDEQSRNRIIQAISAIQHDFARIIVVTHIGEIKDMFPVHIAVTKEEGVSRVALNV